MFGCNHDKIKLKKKERKKEINRVPLTWSDNRLNELLICPKGGQAGRGFSQKGNSSTFS
jgi:hypothetical protein